VLTLVYCPDGDLGSAASLSLTGTTATCASFLAGGESCRAGIALGDATLAACPVMDSDGSGSVTINELIAAVGRALNGC